MQNHHFLWIKGVEKGSVGWQMALIERRGHVFVLLQQLKKNKNKKKNLPKCTKYLTTCIDYRHKENVLPITELQKLFSLLKPFLTHFFWPVVHCETKLNCTIRYSGLASLPAAIIKGVDNAKTNTITDSAYMFDFSS